MQFYFVAMQQNNRTLHSIENSTVLSPNNCNRTENCYEPAKIIPAQAITHQKNLAHPKCEKEN